MFGAGPDVFAVWGYVIANAVDSRVELNPKLLASILGTTVEAVQQAIDELCEPDPESRNKTSEGRRLQQEGQYQYRVTSHEIYRAMKNEEDRREYNRVKQAESRERKKSNKVSTVNTGQDTLSKKSAHTEAEAEAEAEANTDSDLTNNNKLLSGSGVLPHKPAKPPHQNGNGNGSANSKHPVFTGQRVTVFEWMLTECLGILGTHAEAFDLHAWFYDIDAEAVKGGIVIPKRDRGAWLQEQLVTEAQKRGLPLAFAAAADPYEQAIKDAAAKGPSKRPYER